jgi:hypothetical protein
MLPPSSLVLSQGWGLIDLPLRASNEGLLRPRVARAQKIIRLHPLPCSASTGIVPATPPLFQHPAIAPGARPALSVDPDPAAS